MFSHELGIVNNGFFVGLLALQTAAHWLPNRPAKRWCFDIRNRTLRNFWVMRLLLHGDAYRLILTRWSFYFCLSAKQRWRWTILWWAHLVDLVQHGAAPLSCNIFLKRLVKHFFSQGNLFVLLFLFPLKELCYADLSVNYIQAERVLQKTVVWVILQVDHDFLHKSLKSINILVLDKLKYIGSILR